MPLDIGKMHQRVTLQAPSRSADEYGQEAPAFTPVAEVWAAVEPLSGRKLEVAKQVHPETTHEVLIRFRPGVTTEMRIGFRAGRSLNILSILNPEEKDEYLRLMCVERADAVRDQG